MAIRCGHCKSTHDSVNEVRACSTQPGTTTITEHPWRRRAPDGVVPGIYQLDNEIYRVKLGKRDPTKRYADILRILEGGKKRWEYCRGAVYMLNPELLMTAEQASSFGERYQCCVNCFKELTHPESRRRNYGPTCADNRGWPYDHSAT